MEAVRAVTDGDGARLAELAGEMAVAAAAQRGASEVIAPDWDEPLGDHLRRWLPGSAATGHGAWVGTFDGLVCAFALAHVEERDGHRPRGFLDVCFVEPAARGVGLGRLLLDTSLAWMTTQGCAGVDGAAFPGDRSAKNFYEGAGFKARLLTMYRPLD